MTKTTFDPYDFSKKEIGGVPVYYKNLPWAPCIHIRIVFNTGALHDPVGKEGISHFLEHMIFNGSPKFKDKKAIREWEKLYTLNTWNAWTGLDNTCYHLKCLPEDYNRVILDMKDMIFNSFLRLEDIEHERKIVTQEAWNKYSNEKLVNYIKYFIDNIFHGHPHERIDNAVGWPETIKDISQEDIISWYKENYGIGNFYIVITGAVEENHINLLRDFVKDVPSVKLKIKNNFKLSKPKEQRIIKAADEIGEIKEQVEVSVMRVAHNIDYTKNQISDSFGGLLYDLLHERLRVEHSLCYNVRVGVWRFNTFSQFFMNVKTEEKNIELIEKEFDNVIKEIIDGKYIAKFILLKDLAIKALKSVEHFSGDIADDTVKEISRFDGHIVTIEEQIRELEKVQYNDIVEFTKWTFDPEYLVTEIILPSKK